MVRLRPAVGRLLGPALALLVGGSLGLGGCGAPSLLITPVSNTSTLDEACVEPGHGLFPDKIVIIPVEGLIANATPGGLLGGGENPVSLFVQQLDKAAKDDAVKAVVLRVNSPGGTVSASDAMYQILKRFRAKTRKPVVASGQEVVASGAYYVSCGADKIVAQPTTLVGSIGVIFETFDVTDGLGKLGITSRAYVSAEHKDIGSPFRHPTDSDAVIFQGLVNDYFARFKSVVTDNRPLSPTDADFKALTDGRVVSGEAASHDGLVDQVGLLEDAVKLAKTMAHADGAEVVMYRRPYGYGGSIYAAADVAAPKAEGLKLELPEAATPLPAGFYYLWRP